MIMGIINTSPDSFFPGSRRQSVDGVLEMAAEMIGSGADILDIGGYSTRPGAEDISLDEELSRVIPPIAAISKTYPECIISIDTFRSAVAENALGAGASLINDISGGQLDENMFRTVSRLKVPYILMHMKGNPRTMKLMSEYDNLFKEIAVYFNNRISELHNLGVNDIILDVGFGFAKKIGQNYELLRNLSYFNIFGLPLLAGVSRKSMIYKTLHLTADKAMNGTTVLNTIALLKKASILRVHDVREATETITLLKRGNFDILN
ncbi:MAG: dihydropteroate synthase [Cyclobacteriaceae bacterium]|nr:dihydropteroate synthase [Cyclobacteriaceae bacterium]